MQQNYYQILAARLSAARLDAYASRLSQPADDLDILAHYLWNVALSQSLYSTLQTVEITLRNSLHTALSATCGTSRWYNDPTGPNLSSNHRYHVTKAVKRLEDRDRRSAIFQDSYTPATGRVVAELNLGFWVGLFNDTYDPSTHHLWRGDLLIRTFPAIPRDESVRVRNRRTYRNRRSLSVRLNRIFDFRNRVSHHEPIWYWQRAPDIDTLGDQYQEALDIINWISPLIYNTMLLVDDFLGVYDDGPDPYREKLQEFMSTLDWS